MSDPSSDDNTRDRLLKTKPARCTDSQDIPDKPIYADVTWLANVQRNLKKEINHFAQTYPEAVTLDDAGRLRVLPLAPVRERVFEPADEAQD